MYFSEYSKIIITFLFGTQLTYFSLKNLENIEKNIHNVYICSHGQVVIERGFSINKDVTKSHLLFFFLSFMQKMLTITHAYIILFIQTWTYVTNKQNILFIKTWTKF